jgi:hypothetical protein
MPERPELQMPDFNANKTAAEIEAEKKEERVRLEKQKAFLDEFLESIKYDESVVAPE